MVVGGADFHRNALRQEMLGNYDSQPAVFSSITNGSAFDQYNSTAVQLPHGEDMPGLNSCPKETFRRPTHGNVEHKKRRHPGHSPHLSPKKREPQDAAKRGPLWSTAASSDRIGILSTKESFDKHNTRIKPIYVDDSEIEPDASANTAAGDCPPALFGSHVLHQYPFLLTGDCDFSLDELMLDSNPPPTTSSNFSVETKDVAQCRAQRVRDDASTTASRTPTAGGNFSRRAERRREGEGEGEGGQFPSVSESSCMVDQNRTALGDPLDGMSARLLAIAFLFLAYLNQDGGEGAVQPDEMRHYLHDVLELPHENSTAEYQQSLRAVKSQKQYSHWLSTVLC